MAISITADVVVHSLWLFGHVLDEVLYFEEAVSESLFVPEPLPDDVIVLLCMVLVVGVSFPVPACVFDVAYAAT